MKHVRHSKHHLTYRRTWNHFDGILPLCEFDILRLCQGHLKRQGLSEDCVREIRAFTAPPSTMISANLRSEDSTWKARAMYLFERRRETGRKILKGTTIRIDVVLRQARRVY